ncbi:MAG: hypothetical protein GX879_10425 [Bacteroidales bacterium]|nr:hypothetical protein [Bacteroidales bacterium]
MKNRKIYPYIIAIVVIGLLVWLAISIFSKNKNIPNNARTRQAKPVDAYVVKT